MTAKSGRNLWRDWCALYGATLISQVVSGARSLAVAGLLGPQQFGVWKSLQLILFYTNWSDLGARRAVGRQLPLLRGTGHDAEAAEVEHAASTLTVFPTFAIALGLVGAAALMNDHALARGLLLFAPVLVTTRLLFYLLEIANAQKAFALKGRAILSLAIVDGILAPLASWWGGVGLFMVSVAVSNVVVVVALSRALSFRWHLSWRVDELRSLTRIGVPLAASVFAFDILKALDRFVIVTFLGTEEVGYYGLAIVLFEMMSMVPVLLGQVLLPHAVERFGRDADAAALFDDAERVLRRVGLLFPIPLLICWLLLPSVTAWLLPAYEPGIGAARTLLWGTLFLPVHAIASVILIAQGRIAVLATLNGTAVVLGGALGALAVWGGLGIGGVAAAMTATYAMVAAVVFLTTASVCGRPVGRAVGAFLSMEAPAVAAVAVTQLGPSLGVVLRSPSTLGLIGLLALVVAAMQRSGLYARAANTAEQVPHAAFDDLISEGGGKRIEADVESADWRFLLPFDLHARVLLLGGHDPAALAVTAPHRLLVFDEQPGGGRVVGAAGVQLSHGYLPFRTESLEIVSIALPIGEEVSSLRQCLGELRRVLSPAGVLHIAIAGWSQPRAPGGRVVPSWRRLLIDLPGKRKRVRALLALLATHGFERVQCYAHLPSHGRPRYLLRCDDIRSLEFLLCRFPTSAQSCDGVARLLIQATLWLTRRLRLSLAPVAPGLSVVASAAP